MYLTPQPKWESKGTWFKVSPLGKTPLGQLCSKMCERAGLTRHTNHSVRRTAISQLLNKGYNETKVQQLSGHKNIQSLNAYHSNSLVQQKDMSGALSHSLCQQSSINVASSPQPFLAVEAPSTSHHYPTSSSVPQPLHAVEAPCFSLSQTRATLMTTLDIDALDLLDTNFINDLATDPFMGVAPSVPSAPQSSMPPQFFQNCTFNGPVSFNVHK